jgi:uncharacterized protein (DUF3084 family)
MSENGQHSVHASASEPSPSIDPQEPGLESVSSLVSDAFHRLTRLQDELRGRLKAVAAREAEAVARERNLDARSTALEAQDSELAARSDELSRRTTELDARETSLSDREATVTRREEIVDAFQEMIAHMQAALADLAPADIMAALDAGERYEDKAVASTQSIGLTPEEQKRFFAERGNGKSDEEILAAIYAARQATTPPHAA